MRVKQDLAKLNEVDSYSLILFVLYKLREVPEYSAISELAYVLDKSNLLKLCEYFGGLTIKIPTIEELEEIVHSLLLYQYVNIDNMSFEEALKLLGQRTTDIRIVKRNYNKIKEVLEQYTFKNESECNT